MRVHDPKYKVMGRERLCTLISEKYAEVKIEMDKLLKGTLGAVTTDGWTSASGDAYYGFTYHWIDDEWVLHSLPIGITHHKGTTTATDHANGLEAELAKHGLTWNNVLAVVTDTEPTMNSSGLLFIERAALAGNVHLDHSGCVDQMVNMSTKKVALGPPAVVGPQVEDVPLSTLEHARGLCTTFSKSTQLMDQLLESQKTMDPSRRALKTIQDVATRWWSTYSMVNRLLQLRVNIYVVCNSMINRANSSLVNLTDVQWELLKDIDKILKPFMLAQELLEGEKYVTLSLVVSIIEKIRKNLKEELRNTEHSEYVTSMLKVLLQVFTAEWGSGDKNTQYDEHFTTGYRKRHKGYRVLHMLAAFLDPRTKLLMTFCLEPRNTGCDRNKIYFEARRRAIILLKQRKLTQGPVVPVVPVDGVVPPVDKFGDLFDDVDAQVSLVPAVLVQTDEEVVDKELISYCNEPKMGRLNQDSMLSNPLEWWAQHEGKYPILSSLARNVLCIPATSAPTERLFSYAGLTIADNRTNLLPDNAAEIIYLRVAWQKVENLRKRKREA